jgi:hypothetical protein
MLRALGRHLLLVLVHERAGAAVAEVRAQKMSANRPMTTRRPIKKITPTVPPMNFSIS